MRGLSQGHLGEGQGTPIAATNGVGGVPNHMAMANGSGGNGASHPNGSSSGMNSARSSAPQGHKVHGRPGINYEHVQKLGEGAFGVAHLVRDRRSGVLRVLKTINKRQSQVPPAQLEREIRNLKACDHPHIVHLFEYYEDYENVYLLMERAAGGELHQVLREQGARGMYLPERWVATVIRQSLHAISYVHSMGIIHKDLKSENILLLNTVDVNDPAAAQPHAVIIDLGIAELFSARLGRRARCTVVAGTPTHMAPEVWRGNFGPVADIWSIGVVQFELLCGELPFFCSSINGASEWLRLHRQGPNWTLLGHCSNSARALCQRMMFFDERMRPTAQQCLGHSWFKDDVDHGAPETPRGHLGGAIAAGATHPAGAAANAVAVAVGGQHVLSRQHSSRSEDYVARSKAEKKILLQVTAHPHTSKIGQLGELFASLDADRTGCVLASNLVDALRHLGVEQSDAEAYLACIDVDRNGFVDYTEFASSCLGWLYESLRGLLWLGFWGVLDVDGTGVLSREEVREVIARAELVQHGFQSGGSSDSANEVLDRMATDINGNITFDELCRHFMPARPPLPSPRPQRLADGGSFAPSAKGPGAPALNDVHGAAAAVGPLESMHNAMLAAAASTGSHEMVTSPTKVAMRDDEFAQLLDQIEADVQNAEVDVEHVHSDFMGMAGEGETEDMDGAVSSPVAAVPMEVQVHSLGPTFPLTHANLAHCLAAAATPESIAGTSQEADVSLSVDEELTRMLADMASGP